MRLFESNLNGSPRLVLGHDHGLGSISVGHSLYIFHYTWTSRGNFKLFVYFSFHFIVILPTCDDI